MSGSEQRIGDFRIICDFSGFKGWASESTMTWDGRRVLNRFLGEEQQRHPQDLVKAVRDDPRVSNPRPETADVFLTSDVLPSDL
jgi:hypothetical protein